MPEGSKLYIPTLRRHVVCIMIMLICISFSSAPFLQEQSWLLIAPISTRFVNLILSFLTHIFYQKINLALLSTWSIFFPFFFWKNTCLLLIYTRLRACDYTNRTPPRIIWGRSRERKKVAKYLDKLIFLIFIKY